MARQPDRRSLTKYGGYVSGAAGSPGPRLGGGRVPRALPVGLGDGAVWGQDRGDPVAPADTARWEDTKYATIGWILIFKREHVFLNVETMGEGDPRGES